MTFTYTAPPETPKDEVRFWSGDTTETPQSMSDQDITFLLSAGVLNGNVWMTAAAVAERIGDKWAGSAQTTSKSVGPLSLSKTSGDVASEWYARATRLRTGNPSGAVSVAAGALLTGTNDAVFRMGMQDNGR